MTRIGLVWAGRHRPPINYARDVPLAALQPLLELAARPLRLPLAPDRSAVQAELVWQLGRRR